MSGLAVLFLAVDALGKVLRLSPTIERAAECASRYGEVVDSPEVDLRLVEDRQ